MKTIFFQGTFDILNACHITCFEDIASRYVGKHIFTIGLNTDKLIKSYKKRKPIFPYHERKKILKSIRYIDYVIPCTAFSCMTQLKQHQPDVYVLGREWISTHQKEINYVKSYGGKTVYTKNYKQYLHSADIRKRIKKYG